MLPILERPVRLSGADFKSMVGWPNRTQPRPRISWHQDTAQWVQRPITWSASIDGGSGSSGGV